MMRKRGNIIGLLVIVMLIILVNLVFVSADLVTDAATCTTGGGSVLFKVSDVNGNAHAEVPSGTAYTAVACFESQSGLSVVEDTSAVFLRLSSATNAHVGTPGGSSYATALSSPDFSCTYSASCDTAGGEVCVASVSASDNAHVGICDQYTTQVCCTVGAAPPPPQLCGNGVIDTSEGEVCDVGADGNPGGGDDVLGGQTCSDFPPFDSGDLQCATGCMEFDMSQCQDLIDPDAYWADESDSSIAIFQKSVSLGATNILMIYQDDTVTTENPYTFEIYEKDGFFFIDDIRTVADGNPIIATAATDGEVIATWTPNDLDIQSTGEGPNSFEEFRFTVEGINSNELNLNVDLPPGIIDCSDYIDQATCEADGAGVAVESVENRFADQGIICGELEDHPDYPQCQIRTDCFCFFDINDGVCKPDFNPVTIEIGGGTCDPDGEGLPTSIGECIATSTNTGDTCDDDGFITRGWTAIFTWDDSNVGNPVNPNDPLYVQDPDDGLWYYDPLGKSLACVDGQNTLECPAQIQLPFFTLTNLIIAIIVLIIVYSIINSKKHSGRGKKTSSRPKRKSSKKRKKK